MSVLQHRNRRLLTVYEALMLTFAFGTMLIALISLMLKISQNKK